jgi:hypothetical protein
VAVPFSTSDLWVNWRTGAGGAYPPTLFNSWMGATPYSIYSEIYYTFLPLVICIPGATSILNDIKNGTENHSANYYFAKLASVFASGGTVAVAPLLLNLFITAMFVPALPPEPVAGTFPLYSTQMLADLYYFAPAAHIAVYLAITYIVSGVLACLALATSFYLSNRILITATPFIFSLASFYLLANIGVAGYSPINALAPYQPVPIQASTLLIVYSVIATIVILFFVWKSRKQQICVNFNGRKVKI